LVRVVVSKFGSGFHLVDAAVMSIRGLVDREPCSNKKVVGGMKKVEFRSVKKKSTKSYATCA
jgi:hypothetical protein